jgi:hypothetical protein
MRGKRLSHIYLAALIIYVAISLLLVGWPVFTHPATLHVGLGKDPSVMMWCMVWWPYALMHHLNPFVCKMVWAPTGFNLTWSTTIPAISLVLAPVTLAFGPVVSYNIAAVLAPAISAWAAFALCRWLTGNFVAAIVGGVLYGFSPYEIGHILGGHLCFTVNFGPPLCLLLFGRLMEQSIGRWRFLLTSAALVVIQCLISNEVLATMTAFGALAWVIAYAWLPDHRRLGLKMTLPFVAAAYLLAGVILTPFFYFALANGAVPHQPLFPPSFFSADPLGFVIPTPLMLLARHSYAALIAHHFGNLQENEFYLGLPLIVLVGRFFWVYRSQPPVRILTAMLGVILVASMGPLLHVADCSVVRWPWAAAFDLPLLRQALPIRLANYGFLVAAAIVALSLAGPRLRFTEVLVAYAVVALLPDPRVLRWPGRYDQPSFFSENLYRKVLHRGERIVLFPYGVTGPSMLWQAETGMYFSMSGGYTGPIPEEFARWPVVTAALTGLPLAEPARQLLTFLEAHRVEAVVAAEGDDLLPAALGIKPIKLGRISFYQLANRSCAAVPNQTISELEESAGQKWIGDLLEAARQFLAAGHDLGSLNPAKLNALGFLPDSRWGDGTLELVFAGASHSAVTGLWVGPGPGRTVAVGLFVTRGGATALAAHYADQATNILYPYPLPFGDAWPDDHQIHFMLIRMPLDFVLPPSFPDGRPSDICASPQAPTKPNFAGRRFWTRGNDLYMHTLRESTAG